MTTTPSTGATSWAVVRFGTHTARAKQKHHSSALPKHLYTSYIGVYPFLYSTKHPERVVFKALFWNKAIRRQQHLGYFDTAHEAAQAYDAFIRKNDLDRPLNFPDEGRTS